MKDIDDIWHFPNQTSGCYYQRPVDCCWLCLGRILRANVHAARRRATMDDSPSVEAAVNSFEGTASTATLKERQRTALYATYEYLRDHGRTGKETIIDDVYPAHPAGYADAQQWWEELLRPGLQRLPGVTYQQSPERWQYTDKE